MYFLACDLSRFHHNSFRETINWKCIVKDDCTTSCLIELQSFSLSKLYIDPIHRILVPFPLLLEQSKTWFGQIKLMRIFVILIHGIPSRKESLMLFGLHTCSPDRLPKCTPGRTPFHPKCQRTHLNGPIRFLHHLFSDHDHGRLRLGRGPQHLSCPHVGLTVH